MPKVQTVLGAIDASDLGVCYAHEHLLGAPPPGYRQADLVLDDEAAAVEELHRFRHAGGRAVIEMSTADYGRDAAGLARIARQSQVHIVCATGYNKDPFSSDLVRDATVDELVERFAGDILTGIGSSGVRAGLVKAASTLNSISPLSERMFHAAAAVHLRTGAPISTHTEEGTMALEQLKLLQGAGVDLRHVVIGHMDRRLDVTYHEEVASTGAYLGFDQIGKTKYDPDRERAEMILRLVDAGYGRRLLLGGDLARRSYWPAYKNEDAPGFGYLLERFVPMLLESGLSQHVIDDLLVHNPARAFAFAASSG